MQRIEIWEDTNDSIGEESRTAFHRWRPMREILENALDEDDDDVDETDSGKDDGSESIATALALAFASGSSGRFERGIRSCSDATKATRELDNEDHDDDDEGDDDLCRLSWGTGSDGGLGGYKRAGRSELDMALALMAIEADLFSSSGSDSFRDCQDSSCKERGRTTTDSR